MFEIIGCVDNAPDVLGRHYGGKVADFSAIHRQTNAVRGYKITKKTFENNKAKLVAERTYSKLGFSEIDELIKNIFD